uniref:F-box domain-containing protein n=1 Tax=Oryza nivara TaxID=4536 RepID=A0A0E0HZ25_ORYNI
MVMMSCKRRKVSPASGAGAPVVLPEEMMIEVLQWLPVESVLRFRAVCRSWATALSSDQFRGFHTAKNKIKPLPPKLFFVAQTAGFGSTSVHTSSPLSRSVPGGDDHRDLLFSLDNVRGDFMAMTPTPCHGLTLLHDAMGLEYYAATRSISRLPPCQTVPSGSAGLGFDARTGEYKVVRLFREIISGEPHTKCQIYTLGGKHGDSWRPASGVATSVGCQGQWQCQPYGVDGMMHSARQTPIQAIDSVAGYQADEMEQV